MLNEKYQFDLAFNAINDVSRTAKKLAKEIPESLPPRDTALAVYQKISPEIPIDVAKSCAEVLAEATSAFTSIEEVDIQTMKEDLLSKAAVLNDEGKVAFAEALLIFQDSCLRRSTDEAAESYIRDYCTSFGNPNELVSSVIEKILSAEDDDAVLNLFADIDIDEFVMNSRSITDIREISSDGVLSLKNERERLLVAATLHAKILAGTIPEFADLEISDEKRADPAFAISSAAFVGSAVESAISLASSPIAETSPSFLAKLAHLAEYIYSVSVLLVLTVLPVAAFIGSIIASIIFVPGVIGAIFAIIIGLTLSQTLLKVYESDVIGNTADAIVNKTEEILGAIISAMNSLKERIAQNANANRLANRARTRIC